MKHGIAVKVAGNRRPCTRLKQDLNLGATLVPQAASNVSPLLDIYLHFRAVYS
jgi:hypothetical protein